MATDTGFIDYVTEVARLGARLTHRKMFGEFALYVDERVVAFACDGSLYVKPSAAAARLVPDLPVGQPYPCAKDHVIADALLDDPDALRGLLLATAALMPPPKPPKPPKPAKAKTPPKPKTPRRAA